MATTEPLYVLRRGACYIRLTTDGFVQPGLARHADHYTAEQAAEAERKVVECDRSRGWGGHGVRIQPLAEALAEDAAAEAARASYENC